MLSLTNEEIREDIFKSITYSFGLNIVEFSSIDLGYKNLKWKIETNIGGFFVKQYNKNRYPEQMIQGLETSLNHQTMLYNKGVPCPKLYLHNGKYINTSPNGERFVLMGLCDGNNIMPGTANEDQMYSLGKTVGRMHRILNSNKGNQMPLHWDVRSKESMIENWKARWSEAIRLDCHKTLSKLEKQRLIIENNDSDIFSQCEIGWGHWDLFVDNILFNSNSVSAILDFDRMHYVYPEFDISRTILSCCLENGKLHTDRVTAFVKGYREYEKLTHQKLVRSIKLTWWKEAEWVQAEKNQNSLPIIRFCEENVWIADNWESLDYIVETS